MNSSPKKKRFFKIGSVFNPKSHSTSSTSNPSPNTNTNTNTSGSSATSSNNSSINYPSSGTRTPTANPDLFELTASPSPSDFVTGPKTTSTTSAAPALGGVVEKGNQELRSPFVGSNSTDSPFVFSSDNQAQPSVATPPLPQNPVPATTSAAGLHLDITPGSFEQVKSPSTPYNNHGLAVEEFFHDCTEACTEPSQDIVPSVTRTTDEEQIGELNTNPLGSTPPESPSASDLPSMTMDVPKHPGAGKRSASVATLHTHDTANQREIDHMEGMDEEEDVEMVDAVDHNDEAGSKENTAEQCAALPTSSNQETATSCPHSAENGVSSTPCSVSASDLPSGTCVESAAPSTSTSEPLIPSIRLTPVIDHSTSTPAQYFGPIERRLTSGTVRIGRQTESKDEPQLSPYERPIVFKSKVVSRSHAEFFVKDEQWYVQDMRSSSGTFLNRRRLSEAGKPSKPHVLKNGDMLQFGMDFRGGTEEIFKCIKVRVEINYSWKRKVQQYNIDAVDRLRGGASGEGDSHDSECAICLVAVGPCQPLFIAPCSHAWHYKCIRPLLVKTYPHFQCPNCRSICDLEADADESMAMDG